MNKFVSLAELARLANINEPKLRRILAENSIAEDQTVGRTRLFDTRKLEAVRAVIAGEAPAVEPTPAVEVVC